MENVIFAARNEYRRCQDGFYRRVCSKCAGKGWIQHYAYNDEGVCYGCSGSGWYSNRAGDVKPWTAEELAKADAADKRKQAREQAKWEAEAPMREAAAAANAERAAAEQAARDAEDAKWQYIAGNIGDVVEITGRVVVAMVLDGAYGPSRLVCIENENYESVKMFSTAQWAWNIDRDDVITVKAEIAGFAEHMNRKQTTVRKPKLVMRKEMDK